ncbi:hypothetical protein GALMADRAFT_1299477 [Galerina marginata CBS 339.88]|uniref:Secreted protein n=1 Tax=Galerina marginata (strain CBS 339.88) TaxID=685588 RepID=A0A067TDU7_GALM3|nr:hypothetical protein GALMADRAFT_1299477 [Galerina marginata CBS 339.88]
MPFETFCSTLLPLLLFRLLFSPDFQILWLLSFIRCNGDILDDEERGRTTGAQPVMMIPMSEPNEAQNLNQTSTRLQEIHKASETRGIIATPVDSKLF